MVPLTWRNRDYAGPDRKVFNAQGSILTLPVAAGKQFFFERKVRLITDGTRESGAWDVFEVGEQKGARLSALGGYRSNRRRTVAGSLAQQIRRLLASGF